MNYIVTAAQMKRADEATTDCFGIPSLVLMENAARETARYISGHYKKKRRVLVIAGCGNNGGDGMAVGRILFQKGYSVTVFFCALREHCTEAAKRQLEILEKYGVNVTDHFPEAEYDIIIDAVFGIGLSRPVEGKYAAVLAKANAAAGVKIACDIPSGLDADTGQVKGCAFQADLTLTYAFLKRGLLLYPGASFAGKVVCLDIGITEDSFQGKLPLAYTYTGKDRKDQKLLPLRPAHSHKGSFGKVLLLAGSKNMSGACELAAKSLYRTGAGLVRIMTAQENRVILQQKVPEAVLHTYSDGPQGQKEAERQLLADIAWSDCIVAGCGMGQSPMAGFLLHTLLCAQKMPEKKLLLDADALNWLAEDEKARQELDCLIQKGGRVALTPHLLEFSRIAGLPVETLQSDLMEQCSAFAVRTGAVTVCKDARTAVGMPDGRIYLNQSGNSGMATAGAGDVLGGIIGGLAAQGMEWEQAAPLGVFLHGLAGDAAAKRSGEYFIMAHDLTRALKRVLR